MHRYFKDLREVKAATGHAVGRRINACRAGCAELSRSLASSYFKQCQAYSSSVKCCQRRTKPLNSAGRGIRGSITRRTGASRRASCDGHDFWLVTRDEFAPGVEWRRGNHRLCALRTADCCRGFPSYTTYFPRHPARMETPADFCRNPEQCHSDVCSDAVPS